MERQMKQNITLIYILTAYFIGYLMDIWSVHGVTAVLGSILMLIVLGAYVMKPRIVLTT